MNPDQTKKWGTILAGSVALLLINSLITLMLIKINRPEMVTFDMKGTIDTFFARASQKKLSDEQAQRLASRFTHTLDKTLRAYQQKNQVVILVSPAVVTGAQDVTDDVQRQVAKKMQGQP